MGQGSTMFFNVITIVFLVLTLLVAFVVIGVAAGTMDSPIFAPDDDAPLPTQYVPVTLTPSPVPGAELTPTVTLTPEGQ